MVSPEWTAAIEVCNAMQQEVAGAVTLCSFSQVWYRPYTISLINRAILKIGNVDLSEGSERILRCAAVRCGPDDPIVVKKTRFHCPKVTISVSYSHKPPYLSQTLYGPSPHNPAPLRPSLCAAVKDKTQMTTNSRLRSLSGGDERQEN
ncbi:hypothetical protein F2P81_016759 [Scophthalmus maximus]|uniref:Uncharacterized protein n=1 Tax=Scophthalmus maximus TaxID=52904 RepID=A0A6A4SCN1_SCOMX|nr:hypothetical protein F2P81_016759 [Scophthalmus maximus]